ncbi:MAG: DUF4388 domain-containing protein [Acidobacteria bacterium]|jgi:hypothetical protein|nr:DUF4388 domain-containing protein [Acidobacteriota bacterium]
MATPGADQEDEGLVLRGRIEETSVPELLRSVLGSGETGVLTFRRGDVTKSVYLHMGRVTYARSSNPDERLGEDLLRRGKITIREYIEASKLVAPGRRLGTILVELGALESEDLLGVVEHHVKEILLDVFSWHTGEYELVMTEPGSDDVVALNLSTEALILAGIRRIEAWSRVYGGIGGDIESVPVPTGNTDALLRIELTEEEQEVLTHVNGRASIEQICQVSYLTNLETCRVLWALMVLGVVRKGQPGEAADRAEQAAAREEELDLEDVVEHFNQMLSRVYVFLQGRVGDEVDAFMEEALGRVTGQYGSLFYGVDLKQYGRADYDQLLANVADLPAAERRQLILAGLNELVAAIQLGVKEHHGAQEEAVVSGIIKEAYRRLGVP